MSTWKPSMEIVNLTNVGLSLSESRKASKWMAQSFAAAPALPALTIFFAAVSYTSTPALHETFWSSHLNRVAHSGLLLGARVEGEWTGFRCFFEPGKGRLPYFPDFRLTEEQGGNVDWDRFLALAGREYVERVKRWGEITGLTNREVGLEVNEYFTTSILVTDVDHQRRGIGHALDEATRNIVRDAGRKLHTRIHEYILPFYEAQGYKVIASPTYSFLGSGPFKVHFLVHDVS